MRLRGRFSTFPAGMLRAPRLLTLALALPALAASGCGGGKPAKPATTAAAGVPETITVLGSRENTGPFEHALSLKLGNGIRPAAFFVCAAWGKETAPPDCTSAPGTRLPVGSTLRLEQRPPGPAATSPDSPGWGTVGTSEDAELAVPLSDAVTGNRVGTVTFRVTLRNRAGHVLATSNAFTVTWRR
jgi:hypothetical protein